MKLLYISDCHVESPIFSSQVLNHVAQLRQYVETELLCFSPVKKSDALVLYRPPKSFTGLQWRIIARNAKNILPWHDFDVVIFRGYMAGMFSLMLAPRYPELKFIYDLRGDIIDEMSRQRGISSSINRWFLPIIRKNVRRQLSLSSMAFTVSNPLRDLIITEYGKTPDEVFAFSTAVSDVFHASAALESEARSRLRLASDDVVFTYVGGLQQWQHVDLMLRAFAKYVELLGQGKFLLITHDLRGAHELIMSLREQVRDRVIVVSAENAQVPLYLNGADVGLLVREKVRLNQVASPTKYGEYINCGLRVIASDVGADFSRHARENPEVALLINGADEAQLLTAMLSVKSRPAKHSLRINSHRDIVERQVKLIRELFDAS